MEGVKWHHGTPCLSTPEVARGTPVLRQELYCDACHFATPLFSSPVNLPILIDSYNTVCRKKSIICYYLQSSTLHATVCCFNCKLETAHKTTMDIKMTKHVIEQKDNLPQQGQRSRRITFTAIFARSFSVRPMHIVSQGEERICRAELM